MSELNLSQEFIFETAPYLEAVYSFNSQKWYAAHDLFEELWFEATGELGTTTGAYSGLSS